MKTKQAFVALAVAILLLPADAFAWKASKWEAEPDDHTHQQITRHAVVWNSGLHQYLQQNLGLTGGVATHLTKTGVLFRTPQ